MSLERIIRPFQNPDIRPPKAYSVAEIIAAQSPIQYVQLFVGKAGTSKVSQWSYSVDHSYFAEEKHKEKQAAGSRGKDRW